MVIRDEPDDYMIRLEAIKEGARRIMCDYIDNCADYGEDSFTTSMINIICIAQQEIERLRIAEVKEK